MKKLLTILFAILFVVCTASLCLGCGDNGGQPAKQTITGITFTGKTVEYDGNVHSLKVVKDNEQDGVTVTYSNNDKVDVGEYEVTATCTKEGYNTLTLKAKLTINGATITGITFTGKTVDYDGTVHSLKVEKDDEQDGVTVTYSNNDKVDVGEYEVTATCTKKGHNTLTLKAKLTINAATITGITFNDKTVDYNGSAQTIVVTKDNEQDGVTVAYDKNQYTDAGEYEVTATCTKKGHKTLTLKADFVINTIDMTGLEFKDQTVEYDGKEHSLAVTGNVPSGATVVYKYDGVEATGKTEVGVYNVDATVTCKNYNTYSASAVLKIKSTEEQLSTVFVNDTIYFQNNLDGNKLYSYSNSSLKKVNGDVATNMTALKNDFCYISKTLIGGSIKVYVNDGTSGASRTLVKGVTGNSLVTDGTYLYYSIANLVDIGSKNGIYKIKLDGTDTTPTKISSDKASYLTYYNSNLYYSNGSDDGYLYSISVNGDNRTKLYEEKVAHIIVDNGILYFNSSKTISVVSIASAIRKYVISTGKCVKLTTDAGKYLNKIGNYIFYVNSDKITSEIFGDGIYKVDATQITDSSLPGTKVLSAQDGDGFSSLSTDGDMLYYYKLSTKHLYRCTTLGANEVDIMQGFIPPEPTLIGYAKIAEYNGEIYYTNPRETGSVYRYNPTTKSTVQILDDCVSGIYFNNGYMYYSTYVLTNYALWRMNLQTSEFEKISSSRCDYLMFRNNKIYFVKVGSLYNNHISVMDLDGSNQEVLDTTDNLWMSNVQMVGDYIYYIRNPKLLSEGLCRYNVVTDKQEYLEVKAQKYMTVYNDKIYYYNGGKIYSCDLDGKNSESIVSNVDVNNMLVNNGYLYYSSTKSGNTGLFKLNLSNKSSTKLSGKVADGMQVINGNIYFIQTAISYQNDYPINATGNDGYLYVYDGTNVKKV